MRNGRASPELHTTWAAVLARYFQMLEIGASWAVLGQNNWYPLHLATRALRIEWQHRREKDRVAYNRRCLRRAYRERRAFVGSHAGLYDYFAPLVMGSDVVGVIVCGPFHRAHPNATWVEAEWRSLTGSKPLGDDPAFAHFLDAVLRVPVFDDPALVAFESFIVCLLRILRSDGDPRRVAKRADAFVHQAWTPNLHRSMARVVAGLTDERSAVEWSSRDRFSALHDLGMNQRPVDVAVMLTVDRAATARSPLEHAFARIEWQRECARIALGRENTAAGPLSEHGVVLLTPARGSARQRRQALNDLVKAAAAAAASHDLSSHAGIGALGDVPETLPARFALARSTAEQAAYRGLSVLDVAPGRTLTRSLDEISNLFREVVETFRLFPQKAEPVVDRFLEAVAIRARFHPGAARGYIDALLAQLAGSAKEPGVVDRSLVEPLIMEIEQSDALTVPDVLALHRRVLLALAASIDSPNDVGRDLRLRRAHDYIGARFSGQLGRNEAAHAAGLAPAYFSRLFKQRYGISFEHHVLGLRLERAKALLLNTQLRVERVAEQSGFGSTVYFHQAFRRATGTTPAAFRDAGK